METDRSMGKFDQWQKICLAILDNGFVVSCPNVTKWTEWMEESFADGSHWIATDDIQGFRVETVFLGINHNYLELRRRSGLRVWFIASRLTARMESE